MRYSEQDVIKGLRCCSTTSSPEEHCIECPFYKDEDGCLHVEENAISIIEELHKKIVKLETSKHGYLMRERAMFIGTNGSCGYIRGVVYDVKIHISGSRIWVDNVPYDTLCAVNKNWKFLGV